MGDIEFVTRDDSTVNLKLKGTEIIMQRYRMKVFLISAISVFCVMNVNANEEAEIIQSFLGNELRLYAAPQMGSLPVKTLERALVPMPLRVQEKKPSFARIQLGSDTYWVKTSAVKIARSVSGVTDCQSSKDPLVQQNAYQDNKTAGVRGIDGVCR